MAKDISDPILEELEEELNELQRNLTEKVLISLVLATPKKTGNATGNWHVTINQPSSDLLIRNDQQGRKVIAEEKKFIEQAKNYAFPILYINNNVDYITNLNDGSSAQAPAKFIERAINEAERARL